MADRMASPPRMGWLWVSLAYAVLVSALGAYYNFVIEYDPTPVASPPLLHVVLWSLLYLPLLILSLFGKWRLSEFGFTWNPRVALAFVLIAPLCAAITFGKNSGLGASVVEAFARMGEEVFFRGFLILLFAKLIPKGRWRWIIAAVLASLIFALVHTQAFQPGYFADKPGAMPTQYWIADRLFNVFLIGMVFGLAWIWTRSVLPGAIAHAAIQGGPLTIPFVLLLYSVPTLFVYVRKERILQSDLLGWVKT